MCQSLDRLSDQLCQSLDRHSDHFAKHCAGRPPCTSDTADLSWLPPSGVRFVYLHSGSADGCSQRMPWLCERMAQMMTVMTGVVMLTFRFTSDECEVVGCLVKPGGGQLPVPIDLQV